MNKSYEHWENQFLDQMVKDFGFYGNWEIAFKQRLLLSNSDLNDTQLVEVYLENSFLVKGKKSKNPYRVFLDCWHKKIYPVLKKHGFDYQNKQNPNGKYEKSWEGVIKWLREEIFPKYIENIAPRTTIELWQELLTKAENNSDVSLEIIA